MDLSESMLSGSENENENDQNIVNENENQTNIIPSPNTNKNTTISPLVTNIEEQHNNSKNNIEEEKNDPIVNKLRVYEYKICLNVKTYSNLNFHKKWLFFWIMFQ